MSGKRGRSGPPKNTNAMRNVGKYYWEKGILRSKDRGVRRLIQHHKEELYADFPRASAVQRRYIELSLIARTCTLLILKESQERGFLRVVNGEPHLTSAAKELPKFLNTERRCLEALNGANSADPEADLARQLQRLARRPHEGNTDE